MNYRHIYHAGHFADVFKEVILIALLQHLQLKETGYCYIDTHAGLGVYDLTSIQAQKTKEFLLGADKIIKADSTTLPAEVKAYFDIIKKDYPERYPGSPRIARHFLRSQDRMVLSELHQNDVIFLKNEFRGDKQVAVHELDGYQSLKAFLPPKERRGLVFIDPSYEKEDEVAKIYTGIEIGLKRWPTGIFAIWYPIKGKSLAKHLRSQLLTITDNIIFAELTILPEIEDKFIGCGMAIINPPWRFEKKLKALLPWLWNFLAVNKNGGYKLKKF